MRPLTSIKGLWFNQKFIYERAHICCTHFLLRHQQPGLYHCLTANYAILKKYRNEITNSRIPFLINRHCRTKTFNNENNAESQRRLKNQIPEWRNRKVQTELPERRWWHRRQWSKWDFPQELEIRISGDYVYWVWKIGMELQENFWSMFLNTPIIREPTGIWH